MRTIHNIIVSVFVKGDKQRHEAALHRLIPFDWEKEKVDVRVQQAEGHEGDVIEIYSIKLHAQRHTRSVFRVLAENIPAQDWGMVYDERRERIGEDGALFIRLDREKLIDGRFRVMDGGDCFHIR
ncbi:MAG: RNA-binding domain-containing protein, partial [Nanoarchaeota archaeon]